MASSVTTGLDQSLDLTRGTQAPSRHAECDNSDSDRQRQGMQGLIGEKHLAFSFHQHPPVIKVSIHYSVLSIQSLFIVNLLKDVEDPGR